MHFRSEMCGLGSSTSVGWFVFILISSTSAWGVDLECPEPYRREELNGVQACLYRSHYDWPVTWDQARMQCVARQFGDLATVNSEEKFSLLMRGRDAVWIGLHKVHGTNYFKWVDDDAPLEEGFQHSQLFATDRFSRLTMRMECVMLDRQRRGLKLYPCFYRLSYVCQYVPNSYRANYTKL